MCLVDIQISRVYMASGSLVILCFKRGNVTQVCDRTILHKTVTIYTSHFGSDTLAFYISPLAKLKQFPSRVSGGTREGHSHSPSYLDWNAATRNEPPSTPHTVAWTTVFR